ncbi:Uncharacterised protein [Vibrio cholerae]|uniref:Uncharacterized protein n=1 Tax=Vibrio cholerae TaxID=666 RepID=A0A655PNV6_VIBCL|nr:Uncharacterised protein [Vibrio cholerae]CSB37404.1 Uncharacterised protein [Vibrio cholerae]CSB69424.1 Uncharacterised protein [Vibrio cholerae]CSC07023.1 Uncharacterised protein [Vibrio cholerae]CSC61928.1 Uncharacterised protein [Vibrio cholerae]
MESARLGRSISSHQRPFFDHAIRWHFYQHRNLSQTYLLAISHASYSYLVILLRPDFGVGMAYAAPNRTKKAFSSPVADCRSHFRLRHYRA